MDKTCEHNPAFFCTPTTCCQTTSVKPEDPRLRVTDGYMICDAYEAGVGKGLDNWQGGSGITTTGSPINAQCAEAWQHGYDRGQEILKRRGAPS